MVGGGAAGGAGRVGKKGSAARAPADVVFDRVVHKVLGALADGTVKWNEHGVRCFRAAEERCFATSMNGDVMERLNFGALIEEDDAFPSNWIGTKIRRDTGELPLLY